jgi:regulator of sirC expression with transglutaminase-like and TPR domain
MKDAADELENYLKLEPKAPHAEKIKTSIKELRKQ